MTPFVSLDQVRHARESLGSPGRDVWRTFFLEPPPGTREPQAFLIEYGPGVVLQTHFHDVDEFQVVVDGDGTLGRHALALDVAHHARAWTPYGPIVAGPRGLSFLTLRAQRDSAGPRKLPQHRAQLDDVPGRHPWQASERVVWPLAHGSARAEPLRGLVEGDRALGEAATLPPRTHHDLGGVAGTGGAFVVLLRGSLQDASGDCRAPAVAFVPAGAGTVRLASGSAGASVLVLRFRAAGAEVAAPAAKADVQVHRCTVCGSIYDPRIGDPSAGIAPGTPWQALPDDWHCPDCDAPRDAFERLASASP